MKQLLIVKLGNLKYGIWSKKTLKIKQLKNVYQLPLTPASFAGVAMLDGISVSLADLAICLGHTPISGSGPHYALIMTEDKYIGFLIENQVKKTEVTAEAVYPLPVYLRTEIIYSCVIHESAIIPIIDIKKLFSRIKKIGHKPLQADFFIPDIQAKDIIKIEKFKLFECGGYFFATDIIDIKEIIKKPDYITRMILMPDYIMGIVFYDKKLVPIIDFMCRIKLAKRVKKNTTIIIRIGKYDTGFTVDEEGRRLNARGNQVISLPRIVTTRWMQFALYYEKRIIPIIDFGLLLNSKADKSDEPALDQRYKASTRFISSFQKKSIEVLEFSLLGVCQALPRDEVLDIIPYKPYMQLPDVIPIVVGVVEHNGEILPVLDLAVCFGRPSFVLEEWKYIHVKNGDFSALVMTDKILGERKLDVKEQRQLPIKLKYPVVYGCYPYKNTVGLILNVYAMTVHFNAAMAHNFYKVLFEEFISKYLQEVEKDRVASLIVDAEEINTDILGSLQENVVKDENIQNIEQETEAEILTPEYKEVNQESKQEIPAQVVKESNYKIKAEHNENVEQEFISTTINEINEKKENGIEKPEIIKQVEKEPLTIIEEHKEQKKEEEVTVPAQVIPMKKQVSAQPKPDMSKKNIKEQMTMMQANVQREEKIVYAKSNILKYMGIGSLGAAAIFLFFIFIFPIFFRESTVENIKIDEPKVDIETAESKESVDEEEVDIEKANAGLAREEEQEEPSAKKLIYEVKKGDTLSEISRDYTGYGANYPQIAEENEIENPHLIFPKQRIKIELEE